MERPSGTVTFLFTDMEASTVQWERSERAMREATDAHDRIVREAIESRSGYVFVHTGDGVGAAFDTPPSAVAAARAIQARLASQGWPDGVSMRVRIGIHTGIAHERDGNYFGPDVNRAARLMSAAHGGQVLASSSVAGLVDPKDTVALGLVRLRDVATPMEVHQVVVPGADTAFPPLRGVDGAERNLPSWPTELIGREREVEQLGALLRECALVSVVGPGGMGKTRLAVAVAGAVADRFPDGALLVELAPVGTHDAVAHAVGAVLGASQHPGRTMVDSLAEFLRRREALLVLDNCEHVLDAVCDVVTVIGQRAPRCRVLVTSREALGAIGEQVVPIASLEPEGAAVLLFRQRAREVRPDIRWDADEDRAVRTICARLDGIPLAIELAAARCRSMTCQEVAARLESSLLALRGGRSRVERHRTLAAAIGWSYDLLEEDLRGAFERLAVFVGGFTLDAAEHVVADGDVVTAADVADLVDGLVARSLVVASVRGGSTRYRILEPLRVFAETKLVERGDAEEARRRHLRWVAALTGPAREGLYGPDEMRWVDRIRTEFDNIREGFRYALDAGHRREAAAIPADLHPVTMYYMIYEIGTWAQAACELASIDEVADYWYLVVAATGLDAVMSDLEPLAARLRSLPPSDGSFWAEFVHAVRRAVHEGALDVWRDLEPGSLSEAVQLAIERARAEFAGGAVGTAASECLAVALRTGSPTQIADAHLWLYDQAFHHATARDAAEAAAAADRLRSLLPLGVCSYLEHNVTARELHVAALANRPPTAELLDAAERAFTTYRDIGHRATRPLLVLRFAQCLAAWGRPDDAVRLLRDLHAFDPPTRREIAIQLGSALAGTSAASVSSVPFASEGDRLDFALAVLGELVDER